MRLVILDNYQGVSESAAKYIKKRINDFQPSQDRYFVIGLPTGSVLFLFQILFAIIFINWFLFTGSTPLGTYKKLIEFYKNGEVSFKYVKTFNMDEYVGMLFIFIFYY